MANTTRRCRKICLRQTTLSISVGIVSMMKDGSVSQPVQHAFHSLNVPITIYKYDTIDLYNKIKDGQETHWFLTGNGPDFVTDIDAPMIDKRIYTITNKMILFICYSHQLAALNAGATIYTMHEPINRHINIKRLVEDPIFNDLPASDDFFAYYTQYIRADEKLAEWELLATYEGHISAMKYGKNIYSIQVHPERRVETHIVLKNWLNMFP